MSRSKSTWVVGGGGSLLSSMAAGEERQKAKGRRQRTKRGTDTVKRETRNAKGEAGAIRGIELIVLFYVSRFPFSGPGPASIAQVGVEIGAVHGCVAARRPAGAAAQEAEGRASVVLFADEDGAGGGAGARDLRVAFEAKVVVALDQHLRVDGTVRCVADGASFPQGLVLEDDRPGLLAVAGGALPVEPGHGQAAGGLENLATVRVMALHTIHPVLRDGMMLREIELGVDFQVALETRRGILAGVDDEHAAPATGGDVFAAGARSEEHT